MTPERWQHVDRLVQQALGQPPDAREAFIDEATDDAELRALARELLEADASAGDFLEQPALEHAGLPLLGPDTIGPYRVLRCLGSGGMGDVYLAVRDDNEFRREVAIKVLAPGLYSRELIRRFRSERQILASLDHANIARMYEGGTMEDGRPYLVMEYVPGRPLHQYCEDETLSLERCVDLFIEACGAVEYAHRNLVLHLDIKPQNILVTRSGTPKLLDFGIAKLLSPSPAHQTEATRTGARPLTPQYASPEQHREDPLSTASDVYSLGVVLYRLLSGRLPHGSARTTAEELVALLSDREVPRPSAPELPQTETTLSDAVEERYAALRPHLRGDLDAIVLKAIRHEPERRYASVTQLVEDLRRYRACTPVLARQGTFRYRLGKLMRRRKGALLGAVLAVTLLVAFSIAMALQAVRLERQRTIAEQQRALAEQQRALAEQQQGLAEQQRAWAERQRRRAEETATFIVDLVTNASQFRQPDVRRLTVGQLLDYGRSLLEYGYDSPEIDDGLRVVLARLFLGLGEVDTSEVLLQRALQGRIERVGEDHPDTAEVWHELAWVGFRHEGCPAAEALFRRALEVREAELPPTDDAITRSRLGLARMIHCTQGYDAAAPYYDATIELLRAHASTDRARLDVLRVRRQRAYAHWSFGDREAALEELRAVVEAIDAQGLPPYPEQAEVLIDLGTLYRQMEQFDEGLAALKRARALTQEALGGPDVRETGALIGLARIHLTRNDQTSAEDALTRALDLTLTSLGPGHPDTQRAASWLRDLYSEQGRTRELAQLDAKVPHEPDGSAETASTDGPEQQEASSTG